MNEHSMYAGAGLNLQGAMPQMNNAHEVDAFANGAIADAGEGRARFLGKLGSNVIRMKDYKIGAQAQRDLNEVRAAAETELNEGLAAAPGTAKSFFFENGSQDADKINEYLARTSDAYAAIDPEFANPEAALRWREERTDFIENAKLRTIGQIAAYELRSIRQAFEERHALALAQGDKGAALRNIDNAVEAGIVTRTKANAMKLAVCKRSMRGAAGGTGVGYSLDMLNALSGGPDGAREEDTYVNLVDVPGGGGAADVYEEAVPMSDSGLPLEDVSADAPGEKGGNLTEIQVAGAGGVPDFRTTVNALTPDEFAGEFGFALGMAGTPGVAMDGKTGGMLMQTTPATHESMQVLAYQVNERKSVPLIEDYRRGVMAVCAGYVSNPDYSGLTKAQMLDMVMQDCEVEGLGDMYFPLDEHPGNALKSLIQDVFERIWSTKDSAIEERVKHAMETREGLPGIDAQVKAVPDHYITGKLPLTDGESALRHIEFGWFDDTGDKKAKVAPIQGLLDAHWNDFLREEGLAVGENVARSQRENIGKFRDWYFKKDGVYEQRQKDYADYAREYLRIASVDAVADYRMNGGSDWAEENAVISKAVNTAKQKLDGSRNEIAAWRRAHRESMVAAAKKAAVEAKSFRRQLQPLKDQAIADKKEAEEREARQDKLDKQEAEPTKWAEEAEAAARKKAWQSRRKEEYRKANPYTGKVNVSVGFKDDGREEPCMTVPPEEYAKIREQLGAGEEDGIAVKFAGTSKALVVRSGGGKSATFNHAAFLYLYGKKKRMQPQDVRKIVTPHAQEMRFYLATPQVF